MLLSGVVGKKSVSLSSYILMIIIFLIQYGS